MRRGWVAVSILTLVIAAQGCPAVKARGFHKRGNELYAAEKYDEAIAEYAKLLAIEPNNWDGNYLTSVSYLALYHPGSEHPKDKEYAIKGIAAFEKTLSIQAPSAEVREKTERFYLSFLDSTGDKDKAIQYLETQLKQRPNDLALINQIATLYMKKGDFPNALIYFEKRANQDSSNKEAWYTLGVNCWARSYNGKDTISQEEREMVVDKGIAALDKALKLDPNYFEALSYINLIYREKSKALQAVGKNAEAGQAWAKADEYQKQAIELRKAQGAKPKAS
jgi:tetratricopeptide (TPR) repeat protein